MKQLLILFFLLTVVSIAQTIDAPIGYTSFLNLKQYAYEANPGADSLNHNNTLIDNFAKAMDDTVDDIKADVYTVINYTGGGIINGTVTWDDISISGKSNIVQMSGTQSSIAGAKGFTDNMTTENIEPATNIAYNLGSISKQWYRGYFNSLRTRTLIIINPVDTSQNSEISFDGSKITLDNDVSFPDTTKKIGDSDNQLNAIWTDSVKSPNDIILNANHIIMQGLFGIGGGEVSSHTIGVTDSVTIIPTSSFVYLNTTATTSVSYVSPSAITPGLIYIITTDGSDSVTLLDNAGNLSLNGNFVMDTASDVIVLMKSGTVAGGLVELFRSNNE